MAGAQRVFSKCSSASPDSCQLGYSEGPCLGLFERYFYNGSSMACETFNYGGCLGNGNNFVSEKECLQTCRTVGEPPPPTPGRLATCRLSQHTPMADL